MPHTFPGVYTVTPVWHFPIAPLTHFSTWALENWVPTFTKHIFEICKQNVKIHKLNILLHNVCGRFHARLKLTTNPFWRCSSPVWLLKHSPWPVIGTFCQFSFWKSVYWAWRLIETDFEAVCHVWRQNVKIDVPYVMTSKRREKQLHRQRRKFKVLTVP